MQFSTWGDVLQTSFQDLWMGVVNFLPSLVIALIIFIIGWIIGAVLGKAVAQIIRSLKVDNALRSAGVERAVNRAGFNLDAGGFIGFLVKWFIIIAFLVASLDVLGLDQVNVFLQEVLAYLPQVFVAALILLVTAVVADVVQNIVVGAAKAAEMTSAHFLGTVARWAIWVFGILAALYQLGVAAGFVQTFFTGIIIALSLAFGLAFGLGGREHASEYLGKLKNEMRHKEMK